MEHKSKADVFGKCIACDNDTVEKIGGNLVKNEHYRERKFKLSNKSTMKVAFCDKCVDLVKEEDFSWIMKNIILGWEESLMKKPDEKEANQKYRDYFYKLTIEDFN